MKFPFVKKKAGNYLEMIPVRNVSEFTHEDGRITLHVPKFKSAWMQKWLIPHRKSTHFRVHLDETGSILWELIDGSRNTLEICIRIREYYPEGKNENFEILVTRFLTQLYKNRFILFKQHS